MTYAMTLDNSWELMTEDEMYDVNGGSTQTYVGGAAVKEITNMLANVAGWATLAFKFGAFLLGGTLTFATGVGAIVAFASAMGLAWSLALTAINAITTIMAIGFYFSDGGFKVTNIGLFGMGLNIVTGL